MYLEKMNSFKDLMAIIKSNGRVFQRLRDDQCKS